MQLNNRLMQEVSELQKEAVLIKEIPIRLQESVTNCKNVYKDALSIFQVNICIMIASKTLNRADTNY